MSSISWSWLMRAAHFIQMTVCITHISKVETILRTLTMLWEFVFRDLRRWVPQELVIQLHIRLWSTLIIFPFSFLNNSDNQKFTLVPLTETNLENTEEKGMYHMKVYASRYAYVILTWRSLLEALTPYNQLRTWGGAMDKCKIIAQYFGLISSTSLSRLHHPVPAVICQWGQYQICPLIYISNFSGLSIGSILLRFCTCSTSMCFS